MVNPIVSIECSHNCLFSTFLYFLDNISQLSIRKLSLFLPELLGQSIKPVLDLVFSSSCDELDDLAPLVPFLFLELQQSQILWQGERLISVLTLRGIQMVHPSLSTLLSRTIRFATQPIIQFIRNFLPLFRFELEH